MLRVTVAFSPSAGEVDEQTLELPIGATVLDALQASRLALRHSSVDLAALKVGIWGKLAQREDRLRDRDRVELYRPLTVDPKEARRLRYRQHRQRYAGR